MTFLEINLVPLSQLSFNSSQSLMTQVFSMTFNGVYNVSRLYDILPSFSYTTSETGRKWKVYIRDTSRIVEQLKGILRQLRPEATCGKWNPIKNDGKYFSSKLWYLNIFKNLKICKFLPWHFGHVGKRLRLT